MIHATLAASSGAIGEWWVAIHWPAQAFARIRLQFRPIRYVCPSAVKIHGKERDDRQNCDREQYYL